MVFSSTAFLFLFLPLILILYYNPLWKSRKARNRILFGGSIVFYACGEPIFVFLMLLSICVTWKCSLLLEKAPAYRKKTILIWGIGYNVLVLFLFKYLGFTADQLGYLLHMDFNVIHLVLPVGISFYTFQLMSYMFDIYYGKAQAQKSLLNVGLYISLFPALVAGPIVRYDQIEQEIMDRKENRQDFIDGMQRFIYGLAKKVLIANYMAQIVDSIFPTAGGVYQEPSVATAWLGAIAYTLQIYFDFSGYSDMAIGLGRMFGFHFPENFRYPYAAASVTDFWRRWHISLSSWFRDYVYIPLGGNRVTKSRWILNLFIVWVLTGIWHGANWTFILWGLFYFVLLLFEKLTGAVQKIGPFSHIYTMVMVTMAWVMFRSYDCASGIQYIGAMWGIGVNGWIDSVFWYYFDNIKVILIAAVILSVPSYEWIREKWKHNVFFVQIAEPICVFGLFLISLIGVIGASYNPFIYFNF